MSNLKKCILSLAAVGFLTGAALANDLAPLLDPDAETDRINWYELETKLGPIPEISSDTRLGGVVKTFVNKFWRATANGFEEGAAKAGVSIDVQAAQNENDQLGQLSIARSMLTKQYDALLLSPLTNNNLQPVFEESKASKTLIVNVSDSIVPGATHFVGNTQSEIGERAAKWYINRFPDGGKFAIIEGMAGSYAGKQRMEAFERVMGEAGDNYQIVASVPANFERELAYNTARTILQQNPDLNGFYAINDGMALGVLEAVKAAKKLGDILVMGTDGEEEALKSIQSGELTATIDSFPNLNGQVAVEVALRLLAGQEVPRVVSTGQAVITQDNYDRYWGEGVDQRKPLLEDAGTQ